MELANHFNTGHAHYDVWLEQHHPELVGRCYPMITPEGQQNTAGAGDTGAIQVWPADLPRDVYHTDWVADRTVAWLQTLGADEDWFVWMSFPDPHHPWDPPASERSRIDWREVPLPELYPGSPAKAAELLETKPRHWHGYFDGSLWTNLESPRGFRPCDLTPDQIREINAFTHIENELIDEACDRVLDYIAGRGWADDTDILFTTDHGELQGDYGLLFKGPYHVDALMRLPLIWRPAPSAGVPAAEVTAPVGHLDLASTFCRIAGIAEPDWVEGQPLPLSDEEARSQRRERVITEWASEHGPVNLQLDSIYRDGYVCTSYAAGSLYDGTEGELYDLTEDPGALVNRWDDPGAQPLKSELIADLRSSLPQARAPRLERKAPV
jgi:arylsulfatase A-like enzyme